MIELAFYWSLLFSQFIDVKRKDFWQMFLHHIATILLLSFSYVVNFVRIGTLVLVIHDFGDFWLEVSPNKTNEMFLIGENISRVQKWPNMHVHRKSAILYSWYLPWSGFSLVYVIIRISKWRDICLFFCHSKSSLEYCIQRHLKNCSFLVHFRHFISLMDCWCCFRFFIIFGSISFVKWRDQQCVLDKCEWISLYFNYSSPLFHRWPKMNEVTVKIPMTNRVLIEKANDEYSYEENLSCSSNRTCFC